jgi:hypothetical protein
MRTEAAKGIVAYWWKVHPGKEEQSRAAPRWNTTLIRQKYGSLGLRPHWDAEDAYFVGGRVARPADVASGFLGDDSPRRARD